MASETAQAIAAFIAGAPPGEVRELLAARLIASRKSRLIPLVAYRCCQRYRELFDLIENPLAQKLGRYTVSSTQSARRLVRRADCVPPVQ